ncbi:uncharacterized protein YcnI [Haloactinopolyspora alba]|uniref:Uncharacterized protein YcnI n=1 Tax=Haloactinopolyspora alba TaxID=648780 RepID=A0A2P8EFJ8_9ACTN|nr:YcnI family protein [Haloactinopolyspora alba]PSL08245.1 uncharacterized protein YcnI [Haloactinopolyspora alba]
MTTLSRALVRAGLTAGAATGLLLAGTAGASAHVTIRPDVDTSGSWAKITVRVPNESDTAGTTRLRLDLPADTPFPSVRVQPHPGWTAELTTEKFDEPVEVGDYTLEEAVTSVTWTADNGVRIGPDQFDEFSLAVGPLPEPGTYMFPATQTYDNGDVVAWDQAPAEEEPPHPAPTLTVVPADDGSQAESRHTGTVEADSTDDLARGVGVGGVVVGAAGLGIGAAALRRRRA